jgi:dienelactone hydrolase
VAIVLGAYGATPYARAASLIVRAADIGGRAEAFANLRADRVDRIPPHSIPTRHGDVPAQFYRPASTSERTVLVMPGINSRGIEEPRLVALATDIAASGFTVMAMSLPDLQRYRITPRATDVIEDTVAWMAAQRDLPGAGAVGIVGVSFAGGLALSAASRDAVRNKVAFIVSLGGHGDIRRVMRYLATGDAPRVPGLDTHPPHDYAVAVVLHGLADRGVVPHAQVGALHAALETFLLASQLTVVGQEQAAPVFARAREMTTALPEPSRTYMQYVNDRAVGALGPVLARHLAQQGDDDPALSPELGPPPAAPVFLLHGRDDNIIPAAESVLLGNHLRAEGAEARVLLSGLLTHASVNPAASARDAWELVSFWADVLRQ